jgi:thiamine biosynthesis lipoprotein
MYDAHAPARTEPATASGRVQHSRRDFLTGARGPRDPDGFWMRASRQAMACRFEITLASEDAAWLPAARAALDEIDRLEARLSVFRDTSLISHINRLAGAGPVDADADTIALLEHCVELSRRTGGAFDITSTPLSRCWGFLHREGRLPSTDAIDEARSRVGCGAIRIDRASGAVRFDRPGIEINLNAIGKGYALDRVAGGMRRAGITHALLSAGRSSILAMSRGDRWEIDVVSPRRSNSLARVWLRDAALGTSGAGEQFVVVNGTRYGHVIDPRTGWPASGVTSASVIASSAAVADALSTAFLIGGIDLAQRYCDEHRDVVAIITEERSDPVMFGRHPGARVQL